MIAAFGLGWVGLIIAILVVLAILWFFFGRGRV